jgi:hypothetical protein
MRWEIKTLEDAVRAQHGDSVADSLHEATQSIAWKIEMAHYHARESIRILKKAIYESDIISADDHESIAAAKAIILSAAHNSPTTLLNTARFQAEAQMIAAAQSLHSTADIMAFIVCWALNFPNQAGAPPGDNKLNLYRVRDYLQKIPQFQTITKAINALLTLHQFNYLCAYVNTTKHRSLVQAVYTAHVDPSDNPRQGIRIRSFQYRDAKGNNQSFDELWGEQFLFQEAQHIREGICTIGNELNKYYATAKSAT